MQGEEKIREREILYAIPVYKQGQGDITKVLCGDGIEIYLSYHIRSFIRRLAYEHYMDLVSIRRTLQEQLGQKNILPYPFHPGLILLPLKVRKPKLKKDGAFGYINYIWVKNIRDRGKYCQIIFKNDAQLEILQQYQS